MSKIVKWTIGVVIFFSYLDQAFCYNPQLLDSVADSFNERICVKAPISIKLIQENLGFLEEEDTSYVIMYSGKNVFESYNKKTKSKGEEFSSFYNNFLETFQILKLECVCMVLKFMVQVCLMP